MSFEAEIDFCLNFLKTTDEKQASIYSPISILNVLAMIFAGAEGKTAEELSNILGKDKTAEQIIRYYSDFISRHKISNDKEETYSPPEKRFKPESKIVKDDEDDEDEEQDKNLDSDDDDNDDDDDERSDFSFEEDLTPSSKVVIANRVFVNKRIELNKIYEKIMNESFDEQFQKIDFKNGTQAEKIINNFVNETTNGMIEDIIKKEDIHSEISILLINAIYFIGKWENSFNLRFKKEFHSREIREIEFMNIGPLDRLYFNEENEWESVGIPYRERKCWMFIVLPKKDKCLESLIKTADISLFMKWTKGNDSGFMEVTMPLFEIYESYDLQEKFSKLGINHLFDKCNLSGMLNGPHKVDKAFHKAVIKVDEYGTIASAITSSTIVPCGGPIVKKFIADRPFLYFIVSMKDKIPTEILFSGNFC